MNCEKHLSSLPCYYCGTEILKDKLAEKEKECELNKRALVCAVEYICQHCEAMAVSDFIKQALEGEKPDKTAEAVWHAPDDWNWRLSKSRYQKGEGRK